MVLETKKNIARNYIEELQNAKNLDIMDEVMTEDCVIHLGSRYVDKQKYKNILQSNFVLFPDTHVVVERQFAEDDMVATQWKSSFTHTQKIMGQEPTFEEISIPGTSIHKIIGNMIVEVWIYWDRQELMEQLGVAPKYFKNTV